MSGIVYHCGPASPDSRAFDGVRQLEPDATSTPSDSTTARSYGDLRDGQLGNTLEEVLTLPKRDWQPKARPFDVVIVGGGTFGALLAHEVFCRDRRRSLRVLVLETGPFVFPDHVQTLPYSGLNVPPPTTVEFGEVEQEDAPRNQVWGMPWRSKIPFTGLANCVGGRSLYWGGFCPEPTSSEWNAPRLGLSWPPEVVEILRQRYLVLAAQLLGLTTTHSHYFGPLNSALRSMVSDAIERGHVRAVTSLREVPDHPASGDPQAASTLPSALKPEAEHLMKLQLPMAVEVLGDPPKVSVRSFSPVPLLMQSLRQAEREASDASHRRLAIVPSCHTIRLLASGQTVTGLDTSQGYVPVARDGHVVLAAGTIESTRLALLSSPSKPTAQMIGTNLATHMTSNLVIRVPAHTIPIRDGAPPGASAIVVRCRLIDEDGQITHFHHQVTALTVGCLSQDEEEELLSTLFRPDVATLSLGSRISATHVIITVASFGEMQPANPDNKVSLDKGIDEFGVPRAAVSLTTSKRDEAVWTAMDRSADELALAFAGSYSYEVLVEEGFAAAPAGQQDTTICRTSRATGQLPSRTRHATDGNRSAPVGHRLQRPFMGSGQCIRRGSGAVPYFRIDQSRLTSNRPDDALGGSFNRER